MLHLSDITYTQQFIIAEFLYSYDADILIKSDVEKLIEVFEQLEIPSLKSTKLDPTPYFNHVVLHINQEDISQIMQLYFSGQLSE